MEESKQQELLLQMQQQQKMQQRQQQLFLMQHLQKQQATTPRFPSSVDAHLRPPPGWIQTRPVNPSPQNVNPSGPNPIQQHTNNFQQNVLMMMMQHQQEQKKSMMMMKQQQEQEKSIRPLNQSELQFAYQDAWRVCHPDFKRPFASLEDACERLLPYHVVADYEAEEDDMILDSSQRLSRIQQWDNNIESKVGEFTAAFEKQAEAFNIITQKRKDGELRSEERLMIEQLLLLEERNSCIEVKSELDKEMMMKKAQEERIKMAALAHNEQGRNMNPDEMMMMMMMNDWGNHNNMNDNQREENEPLENFLNDEENDKFGANGLFDLNTL